MAWGGVVYQTSTLIGLVLQATCIPPAHSLISWHSPTDPVHHSGLSGLQSYQLQSLTLPVVS